MSKSRRRGLTAGVTALVILGLITLAGVAGCAAESGEVTTTTWAYSSATTAAPATTTVGGPAAEYDGGQYVGDDSSAWEPDVAVAGSLTAFEVVSSQKIISDARLELEVEQGKFQTVFDQAILLADRYGGYLVNSTSYASGEEDSMRSGTVAVRVPSNSFTKAVSDASRLGTLKNQSLSSQDVTEEYVDLEARIKNAEANVESLAALLQKAETVDEIVYVRSYLISAQDELEALKGRMRYLEEHTSYSTITMSIYEVGVEVVSAEAWGFVDALKDGLRNLVKAFNAIVRGLGILIPVLIIVGIVAYIVYLIVRAIVRRNRAREQARYQPYPEGTWQRPAPMGAAQAGVHGPGTAQQAATQAGVVPAGGPAPGTSPVGATPPDAAQAGDAPPSERSEVEPTGENKES